MTTAMRRVVVGTDGSLGARSALTWAADEAVLRHGELLIVHAPHIDARIVAKLGEPLVRAVDEFGEHLLEQAAADVAEQHPGLTVHTKLSQGAAAEVLVELSDGADLVVVGSRGSDEVTGTLIGSVSHRVATHAGCPVGIVPVPGEARSATADAVVAGVTDSDAGRHAARLAAAEAQLRGAPLRLIHGGEQQVFVQTKPPDLDAIAEQFRREYPDLRLSVVSAAGEAVDVLLDASREAQLLVLGCHRSPDRWSTRLGPVPSQLIHRVDCPVLLAGA